MNKYFILVLIVFLQVNICAMEDRDLLIENKESNSLSQRFWSLLCCVGAEADIEFQENTNEPCLLAQLPSPALQRIYEYVFIAELKGRRKKFYVHEPIKTPHGVWYAHNDSVLVCVRKRRFSFQKPKRLGVRGSRGLNSFNVSPACPDDYIYIRPTLCSLLTLEGEKVKVGFGNIVTGESAAGTFPCKNASKVALFSQMANKQNSFPVLFAIANDTEIYWGKNPITESIEVSGATIQIIDFNSMGTLLGFIIKDNQGNVVGCSRRIKEPEGEASELVAHFYNKAVCKKLLEQHE